MTGSIRHIAIACVLIAALFAALAPDVQAGLRGRGPYDGVVFFDRWDDCILFSGTYLMYIATAAKEPLRAYQGQAIEIDAKEVFQPLNPGDGLIRKFSILGPAVYLERGSAADFPVIQGLDLKAGLIMSAAVSKLTMEIRNRSDAPITVNAGALGYAVLGKKTAVEQSSFDPSDGPSTAYLTRMNVTNPEASVNHASNGVNYLYIARINPADRMPDTVILKPGESVKTAVSVFLPSGEYQFLAGYGCGVHSQPCLPSNAVSFDVDQQGRAQPVGAH